MAYNVYGMVTLRNEATNECGEGHDWLDTRLFTITRVEEQKELTKA